jgi:hypothetical protein
MLIVRTRQLRGKLSGSTSAVGKDQELFSGVASSWFDAPRNLFR